MKQSRERTYITGKEGTNAYPERHSENDDAEAIAVRLSRDEAPRGRKPISEKVGLFQVTQLEGDLVYIFSSAHWHRVRRALKQAGISYQYKQAPSFSPQSLSDPATWLKAGPEH